MSAVDFTSVNFTGRVVNFTVPFLLTKKKLKTPPKIGAVGGKAKRELTVAFINVRYSSKEWGGIRLWAAKGK